MFKENYIITGIIECKTGLHIGGSNDSVEIGGSDNVVIRDSITNLPFIPGSSLKGKLRSLIELNDPVFVDNLVDAIKEEKKFGENPKREIEDSDRAVKVFGGSVENKTIRFPTRIIVRDSYPSDGTKKLWKKHNSVIDGAELKYENKLGRYKSEANPRNIERVPKGSEFEFEIIFSVYEGEDNNIDDIFYAMTLLEDNYLGGSGSRGFGQVAFKNINIIKRDQSFYKENVVAKTILENGSLKEARELFEGN